MPYLPAAEGQALSGQRQIQNGMLSAWMTGI